MPSLLTLELFLNELFLLGGTCSSCIRAGGTQGSLGFTHQGLILVAVRRVSASCQPLPSTLSDPWNQQELSQPRWFCGYLLALAIPRAGLSSEVCL